MRFHDFMRSTAGRLMRIVVGVSLVWIGAGHDSLWGLMLMVVGLIPAVTGIANVSLFDELAGRSPRRTTGVAPVRTNANVPGGP